MTTLILGLANAKDEELAAQLDSIMDKCGIKETQVLTSSLFELTFQLRRDY